MADSSIILANGFKFSKINSNKNQDIFGEDIKVYHLTSF